MNAAEVVVTGSDPLAGWALGIAIVSAVAAIASAWIAWQASKESNRIVQAYTDAYWVLEFDPEPVKTWIGYPPIHLRLRNTGEAWGEKVVMYFTTDGLESKHRKFDLAEWPSIEKGGSKSYKTSFHMNAPLDTLFRSWDMQVAEDPDWRWVTVDWASPAGKALTQQVAVPKADDWPIADRGVYSRKPRP